MLLEVDWIGLEASEEVEGSSGLHGECDPADVLEDAASGTPDDEYRSWLNCNHIEEREEKKTGNALTSVAPLLLLITTANGCHHHR